MFTRTNINLLNPKVMDTERLKTAYKRTTPTEQQFLCLLIDNVPDLTILRGKNIVNVERCAKDNKNANVLILDAKNTNLTYSGHSFRTIEFCLITANGKIHWFDAKQLKKTTNLSDLHGEYSRAVKNKGKTTFVVDGSGYSNSVIQSHTKYLKKLKIDKKVDVIPISEIREIINAYFN